MEAVGLLVRQCCSRHFKYTHDRAHAHLPTLQPPIAQRKQAPSNAIIHTKPNVRRTPQTSAPILTPPRTIPLTVLRLIYLIRALRSSDFTKSSFNPELITVIHTNYSIIASCLPFLKPFLDSLAIGLMTNDIRIPINDDPTAKTKAAGAGTVKDGNKMINPFAILTGGSRYAKRTTGYGSGWTRSIVHTGKGAGSAEPEHELRDLERYGSRERMVINQTRTAEVTSEPRSSDPEEPKVAEGSLPPSSVMISAGGPIPKAGYGP